MTERDTARPTPTSGSQVDPGSDASTEQAGHVQDRETLPPAGQATGAGGGYGVGSDRSSGGSGEPPGDDDGRATSADDETSWLRSARGGPAGSPPAESK